ncbi:MAG: PEP-CTERM sorting domain-containing protein [Verrucomicrobia bacterium]|nr:PEP-CTERM sorting domain-containing protein [Verrucomicrobiota bacterium]
MALQNVTGDGTIFDPAASYRWSNIIVTTGLTNFNPANFNFDVSNFAGGLLNPSQFSVLQTANNIDLQYLGVPEPSTWVMVVGGFGMLMGLQRFRRNRVN